MNIIKEFREKVSKLKTSSKISDYEFIDEIILNKVPKVCEKFKKRVINKIAKHYFKVVSHTIRDKINSRYKHKNSDDKKENNDENKKEDLDEVKEDSEVGKDCLFMIKFTPERVRPSTK